jgi:trigger factor
LDDYCNEFAKLVSQQGIDSKKINWDAYRKSRNNEAERVVRSSYIIQNIGNIENIEVTDEEVNKEIMNLIKEHKIQQPFEVFRKKIADDGTLDEIRGQVRTYKTFNCILSFAKITEELLDKDAFNAFIEAERKQKSSGSNSKHEVKSTDHDNVDQLENEYHNNGNDPEKDNCCELKSDLNQNETVS